MEDNVTDTILFAILLLVFALVIGIYEDNSNYDVKPLSEQKEK